MKIAVCLYGHPKFYETGLNLNQELYAGCEVDYYGHFWENDTKQQNKIKRLYNFKTVQFENNDLFNDPINYDVDMSKTTRSKRDTVSAIYSVKKINSIIQAVNKDYDFFALTRTDICGLGASLINFSLDKKNIYNSYVDGKEWLETCIDMKFIMCSKENFIKLTSLYDNMEVLIKRDKIPLCHHRLFFNTLKDRKDNMFQLGLDSNKGLQKGWFFIRKFGLSNQ